MLDYPAAAVTAEALFLPGARAGKENRLGQASGHVKEPELQAGPRLARPAPLGTGGGSGMAEARLEALWAQFPPALRVSQVLRDPALPPLGAAQALEAMVRRHQQWQPEGRPAAPAPCGPPAPQAESHASMQRPESVSGLRDQVVALQQQAEDTIRQAAASALSSRGSLAAPSQYSDLGRLPTNAGSSARQ